MKRGYMERNAALVPDELLAKRRDALIGAFGKYGVEAAVIYGDVATADELHYYVNLGPYWSAATCVLNKNGDRSIVSSMTARVNFWVEMMSGVPREKITAAGPAVNKAMVTHLTENYSKGTAIGMIGEYFPESMRAAIEAAGYRAVWMQEAAKTQMSQRDAGYRDTLLKGIALMKTAIAKAFANAAEDGRTQQAVAADVEYACRTAGAMDTLILAADAELTFMKAPDRVEQSPWTLYMQLQYLGEWLAVMRNTHASRNAVAFAARGKVLAALKPGNTPYAYEAEGFEVTLCTHIRSDHPAWEPQGSTKLSAGQIFSVRLRGEGVMIEDMARMEENGAVLLTDI